MLLANSSLMMASFGSAASGSLIDGSTWGASDSSGGPATVGTESPTQLLRPLVRPFPAKSPGR
ncbi:uncharacterized protein G2W53_004374 [Senna tora]|uniref:Uncharacterized protein n=1 Tax=Senna tora TaxID=362788 RepID=A0A834XD70_9FABA|nr:uncharacterized protein G2W53_004374 [Senna tora]